LLNGSTTDSRRGSRKFISREKHQSGAMLPQASHRNSPWSRSVYSVHRRLGIRFRSTSAGSPHHKVRTRHKGQKEIRGPEDREKMQAALDTLGRWSEKRKCSSTWKMQGNAYRKEQLHYKYRMNGVIPTQRYRRGKDVRVVLQGT
jgi:hypothetical protein